MIKTTCYLDELDHHVKRVLKVPAYLRYMDDMALFADDEALLLEARQAISEWLEAKRGLSLNRKRWAVHPAGEPSTFLGYRVCRGGLGPGRKIRRRLPQRLRDAARRGPAAVVRSIQSYKGIYLF